MIIYIKTKPKKLDRRPNIEKIKLLHIYNFKAKIFFYFVIKKLKKNT